MERMKIIAIMLVLAVVGVNEYVVVGPNGDGIVTTWVSEQIRKFSNETRTSYHDPLSWTEKERGEILLHMTLSVENAVKAQDIFKRKLITGESFTNEEKIIFRGSIAQAISEAKLVSDAALRKVHPELPYQFRNKYQAGLEALSEGLTTQNKATYSSGARLYEEFSSWGQEHEAEFNYPPR